MQNPFQDSPLQKLEHFLFTEKEITLYMKRDDLIHEHIQGNKWRKLKYNLYQARLNKINTILTFGGPYSNHIYATAAAAKLFHFKSIGIIRGEEPEIKSATLQFAAEQGMELYFMDRAMYNEKENPENIESLRAQIGDFYHIPEGGTNTYALEGVEEIIEEIDVEYDYMCTPCGTGGTLAGILTGLKDTKQVIGFSALKGKDTLTEKVNELTDAYCGKKYQNYKILFDYHFGGYAKVTPGLITFIKEFKQDFDIQLEPVYNGKMMYGIMDLIQQNYFVKGTKIIALHTGGLQGLSGFPQLQ